MRSGVCRACNRPFEGFDPEAHQRAWEEANAEISSLSEKLASASAALSSVTSEVESAREEYSRAKSFEESLQPMLERKAELESALTEIAVELHGDIPALRGVLDTVEKELEEAREAKRTADAARRDLEKAEAAVAACKSELSSLETEAEFPSLEAVEAAEKDFAEAQQLLSALSQERARLDSEYRLSYASYTSEKEALDRDLAAYQAFQGQKKRRTLLKRLIKYLRDNRDRFLSGVWDNLLQYASEFASMSTNGDIKRVSRSPDGEFLFDEGDGPQPVVTASGVQKAILGVGVRLALAEALNTGADFMLLDEVTAGASDDISLAMTRALAASGVQIVAVTHRQDDAVVADTVIQF
jgi:DNA repair exonuclease SbcCD ATPase subunit